MAENATAEGVRQDHGVRLTTLKKGDRAIGRTYRNHIDGFNLLPYLTGQKKESPRNLFFYWSDDGDLLALRIDNPTPSPSIRRWRSCSPR